MAEAAGLALGVLGVAGLFKSCIENFDIVVSAQNFSEEFDLLCTEVKKKKNHDIGNLQCHVDSQ